LLKIVGETKPKEEKDKEGLGSQTDGQQEDPFENLPSRDD
jgi:hypothetical protein